MRPVALFVGIALLMACQDARTEPATSADKPEKKNEGTYYSTAVAPGEVKANEKATVVVSLLPGSGYKWNDEYPAKFKLTGGDALALEKAEFSFKKKEIKVSQKAAEIAVPLTVKSAGEAKIEFKGNFSVCNDTSCKIMRNEVFSVAVKGQ